MKKISIFIFLLILIFTSCKSENKKSKKIVIDEVSLKNKPKSKKVKHILFSTNEKSKYCSKIDREDIEIIPDNIFKKIDKKVVFIEFYMEFSTFSNLPPTYRSLFYKENQNFSLPGILIDKRHVLTNYDILKDSTIIFLKNNSDKNDEKIAFSIKGYDESLNLVVLESTRDIDNEVVTFKKSKVFAGDQIFSLGTINGVRKIFKRGIINMLHYSEFDEVIDSFFVSSLSPIVNIGSVVFNSNSEVLGIVTSYNPYYEKSAYIINSTILVNLIEKLKKGYVTKSKSWIGLHIEKNSKKIVIRSVIKNSPAEKSGLQKGDILLQVNKIKLKNRRHLKKVLSFLKPENRIILKIKRKNTIIAIKLQTEFKPLR